MEKIQGKSWYSNPPGKDWWEDKWECFLFEYPNDSPQHYDYLAFKKDGSMAIAFFENMDAYGVWYKPESLEEDGSEESLPLEEIVEDMIKRPDAYSAYGSDLLYPEVMEDDGSSTFNVNSEWGIYTIRYKEGTAEIIDVEREGELTAEG
jgi:hypothetical protein